jgi:hypothetical protein
MPELRAPEALHALPERMIAMSVKVKNGTPLYGPPLCETCTNALIQKGYRESEELTLCGANYPAFRVPFRVRECTAYIDKTRQDLTAMERIAWILAPRGPKRQAGFVRASELRNEEEALELTLNDKE